MNAQVTPPAQAAGALFVLALLVTTVAAAQMYPPPPAAWPPPPAYGYATAPPSADEVSDFVSRITQSTRFDRGTVARWQAPLCFDVEGLPENESRFVVDRLSQIASDAGAALQGEGCSKSTSNFHVVFTLNAEQVARHWYARHRDLFESNGSLTQINRFVRPPNPGAVRVWHNATLFGTDGHPLVAVDPADPVEGVPHLDDTGSRLHSRAVVGLNYAVIIIDGRRANGAGLAPLADYAAMAGLAELDLGADLGHDPTILRLFTAAANDRPMGVTAWDQAFLGELYHSDQSSRNLRAQLAATVAHDVSGLP